MCQMRSQYLIVTISKLCVLTSLKIQVRLLLKKLGKSPKSLLSTMFRDTKNFSTIYQANAQLSSRAPALTEVGPLLEVLFVSLVDLSHTR